ncbi:MFS transporter [Reinekea sp.]|uniref:MFS transporter n=1 Tax=Reinekea sp. TaxID=1970455 RepID=UPI002A819B13|nr:MFS transporter [Reinekea sp.]
MSSSSALHNSQFRIYFIASCFATMAVWMIRFLFGWLIWQQTESFFWVGVASTSLMLPALIITPVFGVISDRINLKRGMIYWLACQSAVTLLAICLLGFWPLSLSLLLSLTLAFGVIAAAGSPLRLTLIPKLVSPDELSNAVGLGAMVFNSARIVAPAVSAWCLTFMGPIGVLALGCLAFLAAGGLNMLLADHYSVSRRPASDVPNNDLSNNDLSSNNLSNNNLQNINLSTNNLSTNNLPNNNLPNNDLPSTNGWQEFIAGLRFSWSNPVIRLICALTLINSQVARSLMELLPALSGLFTAGTATDLATLTAFAGGGSILGGWFMSTLGRDTQRLVRVLIGAMLLTSVAILPLLFALSIWPMSISIGLISLLMTLLGTGSQILLQRQTLDAMRGRVLSLWITIAIAGPALGALMMGAIAEFLGFPVMLALMLILSLLSTAWLSHRRELIYDRPLSADPLTSTTHTAT